ncbi:MAG: ABC transporter permease [Candidatus Latescibacterota bacterium]
MIRNSTIVAKKELRELFASKSRGILALQIAILGVIFGGFIPYSQGPYWIAETYLLGFHFVFVPFVVTFPFVTDCFAGERERKTLETLLTTRLDEKSLFLGKSLSVFAFSYLQVLMVVLIGWGTINAYWRIEAGGKGLFVYSPPALFALFGLSAAMVALSTGIGVFVSLRAESVRAAQRVTGVINLAILLPMFFVLAQLSLDWISVMAAFGIVLVLTALLSILAIRSFRREPLVLGMMD